MKLHDPMLAKLVERGAIQDAYLASQRVIAALPTETHPFRDAVPPIDLAARWHDHGVASWLAAQFAEAGDALDRALSLRERVLGDDHPDTLDTLERSAALAHYNFDVDAARDRFERVLAARLRAAGGDSIELAITRRNRAAFLRDRGGGDAYQEATYALETLERLLPEEHPEVVHALKVKALICLRANEYAEADKYASRAVKLGSRVWHEHHFFVLNAELIVAKAEMKRLGHGARAGKRFARISEGLEASAGEHPMLANALHAWAESDFALCEHYERAEQHARRAYAIYRRFYPDGGDPIMRTVFAVMIAGDRMPEACDLAHELEATASARLRMHIASSLANSLLSRSEYRAALPWVERTRDLCPDVALRAQWETTLGYARIHAERETDS